MTASMEEFQSLLRELFQFDCADLDFGIYRIMNHKRAVMERFITEDLPRLVAKESSSGALADVEQNNIKGEKRFFLPQLEGIAWDETIRQLFVPFEYRPLTAQEAITYGSKNQQETINARAVDGIPKHLKRSAEALAALTIEHRRDEQENPVCFLQHHLRQYTRRNTSDFFIHKDLRGFLSRELDFYLKNEVLNLEEMETAGETRVQPVDLPESFNYLMGLQVQTRQVHNNKDQRYLSYRGTLRNGRTVAVIWRETANGRKEDCERDKAFVAEQKFAEGADEIFVIGDSLITGARALDGLFKERMFAPVEV